MPQHTPDLGGERPIPQFRGCAAYMRSSRTMLDMRRTDSQACFGRNLTSQSHSRASGTERPSLSESSHSAVSDMLRIGAFIAMS